MNILENITEVNSTSSFLEELEHKASAINDNIIKLIEQFDPTALEIKKEASIDSIKGPRKEVLKAGGLHGQQAESHANLKEKVYSLDLQIKRLSSTTRLLEGVLLSQAGQDGHD